MKDHSSFTDIKCANGESKFTLAVPSPGEELTYMVPSVFNGSRLVELHKNGMPFSYTELVIKGRNYALDTVSGEKTYSIAATYRASRP